MVLCSCENQNLYRLLTQLEDVFRLYSLDTYFYLSFHVIHLTSLLEYCITLPSLMCGYIHGGSYHSYVQHTGATIVAGRSFYTFDLSFIFMPRGYLTTQIQQSVFRTGLIVIAIPSNPVLPKQPGQIPNCPNNLELRVRALQGCFTGTNNSCMIHTKTMVLPSFSYISPYSPLFSHIAHISHGLTLFYRYKRPRS